MLVPYGCCESAADNQHIDDARRFQGKYVFTAQPRNKALYSSFELGFFFVPKEWKWCAPLNYVVPSIPPLGRPYPSARKVRMGELVRFFRGSPGRRTGAGVVGETISNVAK